MGVSNKRVLVTDGIDRSLVTYRIDNSGRHDSQLRVRVISVDTSEIQSRCAPVVRFRSSIIKVDDVLHRLLVKVGAASFNSSLCCSTTRAGSKEKSGVESPSALVEGCP